MNPKRDVLRLGNAQTRKTDIACYAIEAKGRDTRSVRSLSYKLQDKSQTHMMRIHLIQLALQKLLLPPLQLQDMYIRHSSRFAGNVSINSTDERLTAH